MISPRSAVIAHIKAAPIALGDVKRYQGELARAKDDPDVLLSLMPCALVLAKDGTIGPKHTTPRATHRVDVMLITETHALDAQEAADDALDIGEALIVYLVGNRTIDHQGAQFRVNLSEGIDYQIGAMDDQFCIYIVSFDLETIVNP